MTKRKPIVLRSGEGRTFDMGGRISSTFKADAKETKSRYAISEWWLEPNTKGPGPHLHEEDDIFYVIEGTLSVRIAEKWHEAKKGAFVLVPGGVTHDFENRSMKERAAFINVSVPGGFEAHMAGIAEWFRDRARTNPASENVRAPSSRPSPGRKRRPPARRG